MDEEEGGRIRQREKRIEAGDIVGESMRGHEGKGVCKDG